MTLNVVKEELLLMTLAERVTIRDRQDRSDTVWQQWPTLTQFKIPVFTEISPKTPDSKIVDEYFAGDIY